LASAASQGRVRRIRELVAQGAQVNAAGADMWAPLHYATRHSHPRAVGALLDEGARVNISTWGRWTPLHLAATVGDGAIARMLLEVRMSGALNCSSAHT
jgi:ankyrin repeat protein